MSDVYCRACGNKNPDEIQTYVTIPGGFCFDGRACRERIRETLQKEE